MLAIASHWLAFSSAAPAIIRSTSAERNVPPWSVSSSVMNSSRAWLCHGAPFTPWLMAVRLVSIVFAVLRNFAAIARTASVSIRKIISSLDLSCDQINVKTGYFSTGLSIQSPDLIPSRPCQPFVVQQVSRIGR